MPDEQLEDFFTALAARAGTPSVSSAEAAAVLELARVVAHGAERRYAPVAGYAAGLALGSATAPERVEGVRAVIAAVERLMASGAGGLEPADEAGR